MQEIFPVGVPVRGKNLIGREKEITQFIDYLKNRQSVILISPRRYGKTSLILEVLRRLERESFFIGDIDLFRVLSKRELAEKIVETTLENRKLNRAVQRIKESIVETMKSLEFKQTIGDFEFILGYADPNIDENYLLDQALGFPDEFSKRHQRQMIFSYDEFGEIEKFDGLDIIKKMRAIFQRQRNVTYIFSGSQESLMYRLFTSESQAFFRFGRIINLGFLPRNELSKYITGSFKSLGFQITREVVSAIIDKTLGHPYYTQLICGQIYYFIKATRKRVKISDVEESYFQAILLETAYFEEVWSNLLAKKGHAQVIRAIALERSPYKAMNQEKQKTFHILKSLEKLGHIEKIEKGAYRMKDPLFRNYIRLREEEVI